VEKSDLRDLAHLVNSTLMSLPLQMPDSKSLSEMLTLARQLNSSLKLLQVLKTS
jgi:hypothetical protein